MEAGHQVKVSRLRALRPDTDLVRIYNQGKLHNGAIWRRIVEVVEEDTKLV